MFFRNLSLFRFSPAVATDLARLEAALEDHRLRSPGPLELGTRGFVGPVILGDEAPLTLAVGAHVLLRAGRHDRILPGAVVQDALDGKIAQIAASEGRKVNGRERKRVKDEILNELLPRSFVRSSGTGAYVDRANGWVIVDTPSRKGAEALLSQVREALGSFPATPLAPRESPRVLMTHWLATGDLPADLALGDSCDLRDQATTTGARWSGRQADLDADDVREHLRGGKQVFQLGLVFQDRMSFVLGEDLVVRKLRFFDFVLDKLGSEHEDVAAENAAHFALMSLELGSLLSRIEKWFGLPRPSDASGSDA